MLCDSEPKLQILSFRPCQTIYFKILSLIFTSIFANNSENLNLLDIFLLEAWQTIQVGKIDTSIWFMFNYRSSFSESLSRYWIVPGRTHSQSSMKWNSTRRQEDRMQWWWKIFQDGIATLENWTMWYKSHLNNFLLAQTLFWTGECLIFFQFGFSFVSSPNWCYIFRTNQSSSDFFSLAGFLLWFSHKVLKYFQWSFITNKLNISKSSQISSTHSWFLFEFKYFCAQKNLGRQLLPPSYIWCFRFEFWQEMGRHSVGNFHQPTPPLQGLRSPQTQIQGSTETSG